MLLPAATEPRPDLPTVGTLSYDGYTFAHTKTVGVQITPVENASGTEVQYTKFVFTFETHLAGGPTDAPVLELRRLLTRYGKTFLYNDRGLGPFSINTAGSSAPHDVVFGPKPRELSFVPLGGGNGCKLTWRIEVGIPDCADAVYHSALMEHETTVAYTIDAAGYSTRTVTGHLVIPNRRAGSRFQDNPDDYLEGVIPPPLPGFRRTFGPRTINPARTRLDYSFTDTEVLEPPPEYVAEWDFDESVSSSTAGFAVWQGTINAQYEFTRDAPANVVPWKHFLKVLCTNRVKMIAGTIGSKAKTIVPIQFTMRRPKGSSRRIVAFSFSFTFSASLGDVLQSGFTWKPVPGTDWRKWATSMANSAFHPRGFMGLRFNIGDDRVPTLCAPQAGGAGSINELVGRGTPPAGSQSGNTGTDADIRAAIDGVATPPQINTSWLYYENEVYVELADGASLVRTLPAAPPTAADDPLGSGTGLGGPAVDVFAGAGGSILDLATFPARVVAKQITPVYNPPPSIPPPKTITPVDTSTGQPVAPGDPDDGTTRRTKASCYVYLRGRAARAGFQIPVPKLDEAAGQTPVPANRADRGEGFAQAERFGAGSTTVFVATWNLRYFLPKPPGKDEAIKVPPNPMLLPDPT